MVGRGDLGAPVASRPRGRPTYGQGRGLIQVLVVVGRGEAGRR